MHRRLSLYLTSALLGFTIPNLVSANSHTLSPEELLGKALFFDPTLSTPNNQPCAVCHLPEVGWTGPEHAINVHGAVYEGAVKGRFGNRKPPSSGYATPSPIFHMDANDFVGGLFWDGRATGERLGSPAADQALGPFLNPLEMANASEKVVCDSVKASNFAEHLTGHSYMKLFDQAFGAGTLDCSMGNVIATYERIGLAIAAYEDSNEVNQYSSKFDAYLAGTAALTPQEDWGRELFQGKGMCAICHSMEPGPNGEPPLFVDFRFHNLGVPKNPELPFYTQPPEFNPDGANWIDPGLGGFLESRPEWAAYAAENYGKHRTPTLRNVDKRNHPGFVKAFMHNGVFKSLKEVVHFYNTRDIPGMWPPPEVAENLTQPPLVGNLGLSNEEEDAIVAFMKTLSDGYMTPSTGESLYMSYCLGCHGDPDPANTLPPPNAPRKVIGTRSCSLKGAIYGNYVFRDGVPAMRFMQNAFSDDQIAMIADYLNSFDGITGAQRYTTTCAGCHGFDAWGGRVDEDVRGEDAYDIKEAIYDEKEMRFLMCLPKHDIYDISYHLRMLDYYYDDDDDDDDEYEDHHSERWTHHSSHRWYRSDSDDHSSD